MTSRCDQPTAVRQGDDPSGCYGAAQIITPESSHPHETGLLILCLEGRALFDDRTLASVDPPLQYLPRGG